VTATSKGYKCSQVFSVGAETYHSILGGHDSQGSSEQRAHPGQADLLTEAREKMLMENMA